MAFFKKTKINQGSIDTEILDGLNLKFVIFSTNQHIIERADVVAQRTPFGVVRVVVWVKYIDKKALINQLPVLQNDIDDCVAFSLSTRNKIGQLFKIGDTIDKIRIDSAYIEAGKTVNN